MSENDHEFDNDGDEDNHEHCWRHVTSFGNGDCGMPRSRHRQGEKALEPQNVMFMDWTAEHALRCISACAGAADPQPGELARLRETSDLARGALAEMDDWKERAAKAEANLADAVLVLNAFAITYRPGGRDEETSEVSCAWLETSTQFVWVDERPEVVAALQRLKKEKVIE